MNIRSVDMQVLIPKTTEVSQNQAVLNQQSAFQQQYGAGKLRQLTAEQLKQVPQSHKNVGGKIIRESQSRNKKRQQDAKHQAGQQDVIDIVLEADEQSILLNSHPYGNVIDVKT